MDAREPAIADDSASGADARVRMLVVDDSAVSRNHILEVVSKRTDIEVVSVESGAQALRAITNGSISLVVCDYEMPDMSGLQVIRFVRQSHSALELPVLMLTGHDDPKVKLKALRAGANDYVSKGAEPEELLARLGTQIELLKAHRRLSDARLRRNQQQKFEAIGYLAEGLAHELNTPAQYIQDNLSFLAESFESLRAVVEELRSLPSAAAEHSLVEAVLDRTEYAYLGDEVPRCIRESKHGIDHVARVVGVMREFARPGVPERGNHSLNEIVGGAVAVTRGQWHQVAELDLELSEALPAVSCVGVTIKQVVLYALMNAVKSMAIRARRADGEKSRLRVASWVQNDTWAVVEISDNGPGMDAGVVERVLDPVLRSQAPEELDEGLAYAWAVVVEQHRGELEVESTSAGTRMRILLPLAKRRVVDGD